MRFGEQWARTPSTTPPTGDHPRSWSFIRGPTAIWPADASRYGNRGQKFVTPSLIVATDGARASRAKTPFMAAPQCIQHVCTILYIHDGERRMSVLQISRGNKDCLMTLDAKICAFQQSHAYHCDWPISVLISGSPARGEHQTLSTVPQRSRVATREQCQPWRSWDKTAGNRRPISNTELAHWPSRMKSLQRTSHAVSTANTLPLTASDDSYRFADKTLHHLYIQQVQRLMTSQQREYLPCQLWNFADSSRFVDMESRVARTRIDNIRSPSNRLTLSMAD
jgi:hypothetical protein